MNFPDDIRYTANHEWIRAEGNFAQAGITDFAQSELGDVVFIEINTIGETIDKDGVFGTVEAVKTVTDLFMPVKGKILEKNPKIDTSPEIINKDPYGEGWLIKIEMSSANLIDELLTAEQYRKQVGQ
ncbi:MAG: glycine cleavage system protein GcvH [Bacteroidetes bacterium]|nr:glycine cleavage system protein GcvH [Bacteroidota bacterium]